jgi:hypothetical protein
MVLFLALAVSMLLTLPSIEVHAQSISISNLVYPERIILGSSATIQADFTFHDSVPGYYMEVFLLDVDTQTYAVGTATTEPGSCELGPIHAFANGVLPSLQGEAACYVSLSSSSGVEHATFLINLPTTGIHHLKARASLIFPPPVAYIFDAEFTISVTELTLTVNTPGEVAVSFDGVPQLAGSVGLVVRVGTHNVSVPSMVQVGNFTRLRFDSWSDGSTATTRTLNLQDNTTLTANYVTQYYLDLVSTQGIATGSDWYDSGAVANFSVPSRFDVIWVFQGWYEGTNLITSSNNGSIQLDAPHTLVARWGIDYILVGCIIGAIVGLVVGLAYFGKKLPFLTRKRATRKRTGAVSEPAIERAPVSETKTTVQETVKPKTDEKTTTFCNQCGARIIRNSKFCKECGARIN